jgi:hypothetical protein
MGGLWEFEKWRVKMFWEHVGGIWEFEKLE